MSTKLGDRRARIINGGCGVFVDLLFNEAIRRSPKEFMRGIVIETEPATEAFSLLLGTMQVFGGRNKRLEKTIHDTVQICSATTIWTSWWKLAGIELHGPPYDWSGVPLGVGLLEYLGRIGNQVC
jgi:hypothetical protein